jgi:pSer/pThr/pTyr-binding forkhead associated (FHA) protein
MKGPPIIIVQLVHLFGPMKGEIQEFSSEIISIGRNPSCHLRFPADLTIVSREHAKIVRDGNRFKLINSGRNGTYVNGKRSNEIYLKNGDVLTFAEGGPKVSFLTQIKESSPITEVTPQPKEPLAPDFNGGKAIEKPEIRLPSLETPIQVKPAKQQGAEKPQQVSIEAVKVPLTIQYGPTIRSFKELPVTIGKNPICNFVIHHQAILDRHAQIFFSGEQYWIKDLTGKNTIYINGLPISLQAPLKPDDEISLTTQGPVFRCMGEGRLAEVISSPNEDVSASKERQTKEDVSSEKESKGFLSWFKQILDAK